MHVSLLEIRQVIPMQATLTDHLAAMHFKGNIVCQPPSALVLRLDGEA